MTELRGPHESHRRILAAVAMAVLVFIAAHPAQAQTEAEPDVVGIRLGNHPGFGRIVFDLGSAPLPSVVRTGDVLTVDVAGMAQLRGPAALPRNVRGVSPAPGLVTVTLAPGAMLRRMTLKHRLVLDVMDAVSRPAALRPVAQAAAKPPSPAPAAAQVVSPVPASPAMAEPPPPALVPRPEIAKPESVSSPPGVPSAASAEPMVSNAVTSTAPGEAPGYILSVPFPAQVGAAALRRGDEAMVVFDERKPVDLGPLRDDPVFGNARIQLLPAATVVRMHLPPATELRLSRSTSGWAVTAIGGDATAPKLRPIEPAADGATMRLPADAPGMVVSVPDRETGGALLIGTQRQAGQGIAVPRRTPDFALVPTWQGVAVEALSDAVALHATDFGFAVGAEGDGRALVSSVPDAASLAAAGASQMSRVFDFPAQRTDALMRRLQGNMAVSAATPVQSRAAPRKAAAEAMIALGMGAEAQAMLALAATDDARANDDPGVVGLSAIAALLAGRTDEADGLDDRRLDGSDEIQLWRAVRDAGRAEGSPAVAQAFATTLPLLLAYPAPLRHLLLPLAAETMAQGGQLAAVNHLLDQRKDDTSLDMARALARQAAGGDPTEALAMLDRLALSPDRRLRARAAQRSAELKLASGRATPAETAQTLSKLLLAWQDDATDPDRRLRIAELMAASAKWRPALALLRETKATWPDRKDTIRAQMLATFDQALGAKAQDKLSPFDLVTLTEENPDLLPDGEAGQHLAERVSDRLVDLDLPGRAAPLLGRLVTSAPPGVARSAFGGRLAAVRMQQNDPAGAVQALTRTAYEIIPPSLLESRTLTFAAAVAAQGDLPSAAHALSDLDTEAGDALRAKLREDAKDWAGAVSAWRSYAARVIPADGKLNDAQATTLVRLAAAAAQAGDDATLASLRASDTARLPPGKIAEMFALLTEPPVRTPGDLSRSGRDVALIRAVPGALSALAAPPGPLVATR